MADELWAVGAVWRGTVRVVRVGRDKKVRHVCDLPSAGRFPKYSVVECFVCGKQYIVRTFFYSIYHPSQRYWARCFFRRRMRVYDRS